MKVKITDPESFVETEVEIDDLANNIARNIHQNLKGKWSGTWKSATITQLIYGPDGDIRVGIMFRDGLGEDSAKKYRIIVEKIIS